MKQLRHLKLLAAVTVVLLALSGFSQARSSGGRGGGGKSHGGGGGGCSSKSSSSHSGSSDSYDGSSSSGYGSSASSGYGSSTSSGSRSSHSSSSSSSSGGSGAKGSGRVTECAAAQQAKGVRKQGQRPGATVRVRNSGEARGTFTVSVEFLDGDGEVVDTGSAVVSVAGGRSASVKVPMGSPERVRDVVECELESVR
ncbi:hypothetical protein FM076_14270 [Streptomyces albus subsp. chlorinus]|uniref:hypothetical protein n=1 Tax=Streptomyces albus TaxID=1888 RepID=UPI001570D42C|nr:hypothetical protein [Streptomyces albus]NSC22291.1 hypothetical protein [Streptomyces albus subsp. chlorinus]